MVLFSLLAVREDAYVVVETTYSTSLAVTALSNLGLLLYGHLIKLLSYRRCTSI